MKIADYGKAITSYIESPTTAQKLKSKKLAGLMEEYLGDQLDYQKAVEEGFQGTEEEYRRYKSTSEEDRTFLAEGTPFDFSGLSVPQLKLLYKRYTGTDGPSDPKQLISELKRLIKGLDEDGIPFATGGRVHLAEGSEDIVEPSKSMQVDTTTKGLDLFTIDDFKKKAEIYVGAYHNNALPTADIKSALNKFTQKGIDDGTFSADDAIKVVQDLKFQFQDRAQKQRLRNNIIAGTGTVEREERAIGGGVIEGEDLGTREGFANPVSPLSKPEVLKRIIELHQKNKLGAEAIAKVLTEELGFKVSRAPVGKQLTKLKAQGLIKDIPYAERAAAINQRGEFYGLPAGEKYLKIREVRDIDRKTRFKDTGKLKYNIPADAKFKIDFKNPEAALISEIPDELQGVQYYKTKKDAQKALNKRNALVLTQPADPNAPQTKAYLKRQKLLKRNAPFNFNAFGDFEFHHIMNIGGPIALDTSDIAIVSKAMNRKLAPYNRRLNNIGEEIFNLIETKPEGYLEKIKEQNKKGKGIITEVKSKLPREYRKLIGFNEVVPTFDSNKNVTGFIGKKFGGSEIKDGIKLADLSKNEIKGLKKQMISDLNKFQSTGLKDKILSSTGKVLKGVGKVIKPIGYAVGTKALFDARALAKEKGIELSFADQAMALDSGDPNVAINNYMRRNDPEFAAAERAKDLAKMTDDFEEVGQTTFGKYNDQIKNIKLP